MENRIAVSVFMLTYNHEKYIRQALDSILMQKVNFQYEIVIGDDASIDGTQNILKEYYRKYPERFRLILRKKNLGPTKNMYHVLTKLRGDYIACLEGDDYWTDDEKLQKQFDFMESHREYSGCMHDYMKIGFDGEVIEENAGVCRDHMARVYEFKDNCCTLQDYENTRGIPSHANTLFFRNFSLDNTLDLSYFYKADSLMGDQTLFLSILSKGNIYRMSDNMSVYRFVKKEGEANFFSIVKNRNIRYEVFMYQTKLEYYLREKMNCIVDLTKYKKSLLTAAVGTWVTSKKYDDFKVVCKIVFHSGNVHKYGFYALKAIGIKQYYLLTGQKDRMVQI